MSDLVPIEQDQFAPPAESLAADGSGEPSKPNPLLKIIRSARRHWLLVLGTWVLVAGPAAAAIWHYLDPTYTASAQVEITPVQAPILFVGEIEPIGAIDVYLNTQSQMIASSEVLKLAISDPTLAGLPVLNAPEPISAIKSAIEVKLIPRTYLLRVNVTQRDPKSAMRITKAVMKAYDAYAYQNGQKIREENKGIVRAERDRLNDRLKQQQDEIYNLAADSNTNSLQILELLQQGALRRSDDTHTELEKAKLKLTELNSQFKQLEMGLLPTTTPAEDYLWKERYVEDDVMVAKLREEIAQAAGWLAKTPTNQAYIDRKKTLETRLDQERKRAAAEADEKIAERHDVVYGETRRRLEEQIAAQQQAVATLQQNFEREDARGMSIGKRTLEIQRLQSEAAVTEKERDRAEERLRQLDIESRRQPRIIVYPDPEILPDGVRDGRLRYTIIAVCAGLFLGVALAFVKDFAGGRLYTPDDVEGGMGLRLLGSLPSVHDLKRGRITEEDFRESYRTIRATLAGCAADGKLPRSILITSAQAAEGKTSLAVSLAASLAESGHSVLIVDGDVQAPRIGLTLKMKLPFGLRHVLKGERSLQEAVGATPVPSLSVLLGGRNGHSAAGMLTSRGAAKLVKSALERFDHVIIDSPPVLGAADAVIWSQVVDGTIISFLSGRSDYRATRQANQRVLGAGGRILGGVICNLTTREHYRSYCSYSSVRTEMAMAEINEPGAQPSNGTVPYFHLPPKQLEAEPVESGPAKK